MKSYKQIFFSILLSILVFIPNIAFAQTTEQPDFFIRIPIKSYDNSVYNESVFTEQSDSETTYYISGQPQTTNLPILMENGRTMLPLRLIGEACGANVAWNSNEQQAIITLNNHKTIIKPSSSVMLVNNEQLNIDTAPLVHNDTLYLPLRSIGEALGKKIIWQSKLGQSFIIVCNQEQNFSNRRQFNELLSQTYLKQMLLENNRKLLFQLTKQVIITAIMLLLMNQQPGIILTVCFLMKQKLWQKSWGVRFDIMTHQCPTPKC